MLLAQGQIDAKKMAFYMPIGCVRFGRYCNKFTAAIFFVRWIRQDCSPTTYQVGVQNILSQLSLLLEIQL